MIKKLLLSGVFLFTLINFSSSQCEINVSANPTQIVCGQSATLSAFGSSTGQIILDEDFNSGGFGPGWGSTPGATSFTNPCSPGGVDGTPHAWMDNNTSVPRTLVSATYDLTAATAGVTICFDLLFAVQGQAAPCEGPDEPDEGVYLQYSTNGGATWIDIHYFDPNGGNDPQLTNWNNWCFQIPFGAITANTMFRWHQTADSGANYDHWGIDNVQIFQNDINAEVVWLHDGYSYGVGNPGGENPTDVSPTSTTTYTAQITTGTGDVCTADISVIVVDPVFDVNVTADPTTICDGECTDITGTANWVVDPGGIETYENAEVSFLAGVPSLSDIFDMLLPCGSFSGCNCPDGSSVSFLGTCPAVFDATLDMNINVTTLNGAVLPTSSIETVCIDFVQMLSGDFSDFAINLICPDGSSITLANAGDVTGTQINNMCFDMTATNFVSAGTSPYTGSWLPVQPFSNLNGCTANGVYTLQFSATFDYSGGAPSEVPAGTLFGWNITFDDPPILAPVDISWSPTTGLADPSSINTEACPLVSTDYELTVSNGTPGCATYTEIVSITVDPCSGCVPPVLDIDPLVACAPSTVDLANGINVSSDPATISFHGSQVDAQNDVNPIAQIVGTSGSYWIRAEDPLDPTCFEEYEVIVTINPVDDASFTLTDFCAGSANSATGIATAGGTFTFNPAPGDGATINASTGSITNGVTGTTYIVQYLTNGTCPASSTETVMVTLQDDASFTLTDFCAGSANSATGIATVGGTFAFNPAPGDGATINGTTGEITNGVTGTTYTVEYTTVGACSASSTETVTVSGLDYTVSIVDENCGAGDGEINLTPVGGTPGFTYSINGGVTTQGSSNFAGLGAGNYSIEITDALGCVATGNESVANLGGAVIDNITPIDESCPGACDGSITVAVSGGNPPYSYQWFDDAGNPIGSNAATIDNLCAGDYSVEVSDAAGGTVYYFQEDFGSDATPCTSQGTVANGYNSGAGAWITTLTGFNDPDANIWFVSTMEEGVGAGNCGTGCGVLPVVTPQLDRTLHLSNVDLMGLILPDQGAAYNAGGLCGAGFCVETDVRIESPAINLGGTAMTLTFDYIHEGDGTDQCELLYFDGAIWNSLGILPNTTVCGGGQHEWAQYTWPIPAGLNGLANFQLGFRWTNNDDGIGNDPSVAIDNIIISEISGAGCASTDFATLTAPVPVDPSFTLTDFCSGTVNSASGIATAGGTFDFNPAPGDGATIDAVTGEISNTVPGTTYTVEYTTGGACPETSIETVEAQDCCNIVLDTTSTIAPSCGQADGTINVQAVGGDGNYTYSIDNGLFVVTNSFTNLASGTYEIVVQDGSGICSDTIDVQLSDLNAPIITAVNVINPLCNGDVTGEVEVIANGGFGALDYEIGNPTALSNNATGVFTGLAAGNYTITVTDDNGCQTTDAGVISEPTAVTVAYNSTDVSCFGLSDGEIEVIGGGGTSGYNYSIDNGVTWNANSIFSGLTAQTYQVVVEDANGCLSVVTDVVIGESNALVVNTLVTDVSCFNSCDGSITWNVVGGTAPYDYVSNGVNIGFNAAVDLCAGNYNYTVTDANGCSNAGVETVQPGVQIVPIIIARIDDGCTDDCDGEIVMGSNTGVTYTLNGISNGTGVFTELCAGNYTVLITDVDGCTTDQEVIIGTTPPTYADFLHFPSTLTVYNSTVSLNNNSINADEYLWQVTGENGYSHTYTTEDVEHTFPSDTGTYQVCLTAINTGGCQDEMCVTIIVEDEIAIYVPNSFTPDDDEFNQTFRAYVNGIDLFDFDFLIFNRWGELIWESHDASIGWDGTYKGKMVQEGSYVWKIVVKDLQLDYRRTYTGHVSILK